MPLLQFLCSESLQALRREMGEKGIPSVSGFAQVSGFEGNADPAFGVVRLVDGVMDPPGSVVVPEVMIRIL
jgi:hypothetical protein